MIEMASTAGSLNVVVEHVKLDGTVQAGCKQPCVGVSGIYNGEAQDGSYVDDVEFYGLGATSLSQSSLTTGLFIDTGAAGSGPYSKITFSGVQSHSCTDTSSPPSCSGKAITCPPTAAVQIRAATRGLHSLTTTTLSTQCKGPFAGIYLDASDTTIEDVHSEGFYDAIVVGANAAQGAPTTVGSNMVWNVTGGYGGNSGPTTNTIHVCNPTFGSQTGACSSASDAVSDLAIFQVQSSGGYKNGVTAYHATTIEDDLTGTTINSNAFPTYVGTYILGEPVGTSQYSRFATTLGSTNGSSATVPTWAVGSTVLTGLSCTTPGAIYSNTRGSGSGTGSNTLYLCSGSNWLAIENQ